MLTPLTQVYYVQLHIVGVLEQKILSKYDSQNNHYFVLYNIRLGPEKCKLSRLVEILAMAQFQLICPSQITMNLPLVQRTPGNITPGFFANQRLRNALNDAHFDHFATNPTILDYNEYATSAKQSGKHYPRILCKLKTRY